LPKFGLPPKAVTGVTRRLGTMIILAALAVALAVLAGGTAPPPARSAAPAPETITLAPGQKVTTTTVFRPAPATYTVTVSGTIVETNPPFGPKVPPVVCTYDAFYQQCTGGPNPPGPPSATNPGLTARSATLNSSLDIFTRSRARPAFSSGHSYTIRLDKVDAGTLLLEAWPRGSQGPGVTHTGSLTVQITAPPKCAGRTATIFSEPGIPAPLFGTRGDDVIVGSDENDQIFGRRGSDLICGGGGNDLILGNEGADTINGEGGDDTIRGGDDQSPDRLGGQKGDDKLFGGPGPDRLVGGSDEDRLVGGDGDDDLFGGPGRDRLFGGERADTLDGEDGNDYLNGGGAPGRLKDVGAGGPGVDTCVLLDFRLLCEKR
jgi:Ca2+-binding RTX toxin-like protein